MRELFAVVIGLAAGLWLVSSWLAPEVNADTPIVVLPVDNIVLHLPRSPSVDRIVMDLHTELRAMGATTTDQRIADSLGRIENDHELLEQVATSPVEKFDAGEAAATATALYDIQLDSDVVIVVVATVELVPAYGSTAGTREHEDGHALINRSIAQRCAADALRVAVEAGYRGRSLINKMTSYLVESSAPVHDKYHDYVWNAGYGQHIRRAEQAIAEIAGCAAS